VSVAVSGFPLDALVFQETGRPPEPGLSVTVLPLTSVICAVIVTFSPNLKATSSNVFAG
jgi:hypothetical protein